MEPSRCVNQESGFVGLKYYVFVIKMFKNLKQKVVLQPDKDDKAWQPPWVSITTTIPITSPQVAQRGTKNVAKRDGGN